MNFVEGQGHSVKGQGQICDFDEMCLAYQSYTIGLIDTKMKTLVK